MKKYVNHSILNSLFSSKKRNTLIKKICFYLFLAGIIYFFGNTLYLNFSKIKEFEFHINFYYLFLSLITFLAFFYSLGELWKRLVNEKSITNKEIHYINAVSWISKYIPGKIAVIATKVLYLEKKGVPKKLSFLSCLYEHFFQIISSFALSLPFIIYYFWGTDYTLYITLSCISLITGLFFIHPYIFNKVLNFLLALLKKPQLEEKKFLHAIDITKYLIGYSLSMLLKGISFVFLVVSITGISSFGDTSFLIFAWIFAGVIGILAIFSPNGLGVREGVLTLLLTLVLPIEIAIIVSIASRLWFSICDGIIGSGILWYNYINKEQLSALNEK